MEINKAIADSLHVTEMKVRTLETEVTILEMTEKNVFKAPPMEWIADRIAHAKEVLEEKTEQSPLLLRKLLGQIKLQPVTPEIGKPYLLAVYRLQPLALFEEKRPCKGPFPLESETDSSSEIGSNSLHWWNITQVPGWHHRLTRTGNGTCPITTPPCIPLSNASPPTPREGPTHDSGPRLVAGLCLVEETFTPYPLPAFTGAFRPEDVGFKAY